MIIIRSGKDWNQRLLQEDCTNGMHLELRFPEEYQKATLYVLPHYSYIHVEPTREDINLTKFWSKHYVKYQSEGLVSYIPPTVRCSVKSIL